MLMFTLANSFWNTFNLSCLVDLTFQVLCNFALYSIRLCFYHQSHPQLDAVFALAPISSFFLVLFLHSSPVAYGHLPSWGIHLSVSYLFAFSFCSWISQGKNTGVVCRPPLQWIMFCQNSPLWPISWVFLYNMAQFLTQPELDKAVVHVISLVSFLWLWFSFCLPSDGEG